MVWDNRDEISVDDLGFLSCVVVTEGVAVVSYLLLHGFRIFHC